MTINVTEDNIRLGERGSHFYCPIALAVQRDFVGCYHAAVGAKDVMVFLMNDLGQRFDLPSEATQFIRDFDNQAHVAPFSFTLMPSNPT